MQRYLLLVVLSLISLVVLHQFLREQLADALIPKERLHQILVAVLLIAVTFLWAGMMEWLLRRFIDRPNDSDA